MHKLVNTWWCWHICKGEEVGEEEEVKPGSGCCLGGTTTPYPVHPHPHGGDHLDLAESKLAPPLTVYAVTEPTNYTKLSKKITSQNR
jgi:hypothetical protein